MKIKILVITTIIINIKDIIPVLISSISELIKKF
jgi:hypothetical protein